MCRQESIKFACGHTEVGFLFECPIGQNTMRNHYLTETSILKNKLVCFACDIPNLYPANLRDYRRQAQLAALARQKKQMEDAAENGVVNWTSDLVAAKKRREELEHDMEMEKEFQIAQQYKRKAKEEVAKSARKAGEEVESILGDPGTESAWLREN